MPRPPSWSLLGFALLLPAGGEAQVRASEPATLSQTVDGTRLTITYSRPRARGRDSLFGKVVHWGEVWTPGANLATTLEVDKPVRLNGRTVAKGKYSVWMVVRRQGDWTFVLDPRADLFHEEHPDSTPAQIRFPVRPEQRPYLDVLTWSVPELSVSGATLAMQWGTTYLPVHLEVEPSYRLALPEREAAPFLGRYAWSWKEMPGGVPRDVELSLTYENGRLIGRWEPPPWPEWSRFVLIRIAEDWFIPGILDPDGVLYEVVKEMVLEFKRSAGRAVSLEARFEDDKVTATAIRKP